MAITLSHEKREWLPAYLITVQVLTTVLLGIRLLSRFQWRGGKLGLDDLFITIGWCLSTAGTGVSIEAAVHYGFDRHIWDVPLNETLGAIEYGFIISLLYVCSTSFTKISILLFYRRLVRGTYSPRFKWAIWAAIAVIVAYTIIVFSLIIATCLPVQATWLRYDIEWSATNIYHCASVRQVTVTSLASGILSVLTDFYTVLLPAWLFLKIKISRRQRVGMMGVFGIGFIVVIAGIVRTVYLVKAEGPDIDKTWNTFNAIIAGKTEGDFGIMCACAPSLKSYFRHYFKDRISTKGSTNKSRSTENSNSISTGTQRSEQVLNTYGKEPWNEKTLLGEEDISMDNFKRAENMRVTYAESLERGRSLRRSSSGGIELGSRMSRTHFSTPKAYHATEDTLDSRPATALDEASDEELGAEMVQPGIELTRPEPAFMHTEYTDRRANPLRAHPPSTTGPQSWLFIESSEESSDDEAELARMRILFNR